MFALIDKRPFTRNLISSIAPNMIDAAKFKQHRFFLLIIFWFLVLPGAALNNSEAYGVEEGLYHGNVNSFLINSQGFMWLSSDDGLHRFDGYNFLNYSPSPENFLLRHEVNLLFEDNNGDLWMRYLVDGLVRFSIREERFYNHLHDKNVAISQVVYDELRDRIWVASSDGLYIHHLGDEKFVPVTGKNKPLDNTVKSMCLDTAGNVWLGTPSGLSVFDPADQIYHNYTTDPDDPSTISMNYVLSLHRDKQGNMWAGTQWGINRVISADDGNIGQLTFERIIPRPGNNQYNFIYEISSHPSGDLWLTNQNCVFRMIYRSENGIEFVSYLNDGSSKIAVDKLYRGPYLDSRNNVYYIFNGKEKGLYCFDYEKKIFRIVDAGVQEMLDAEESFNLNVAHIDDSDVLWIGIEKVGILRYNLRQKDFHVMLPGKDVYGINKGPEGRLFAGSRAGLNIYDPVLDFWGVESPSNNETMIWGFPGTIRRFGADELWIGFWDGLMSRYDIKQNRFHNYEYDHTDPTSLETWSVREIFKDSGETIWVGGTESGLTHMVDQSGTFSYPNSDTGNGKDFPEKWVMAIHEDPKGNLWLGGRKNGLYKYNKETGTIKNFTHHGMSGKKLSHEVREIHQSEDGTLWLATRGAGLLRFDVEKEEFQAFTQMEGLPSNIIQSLVVDKNGRFWMGTVNGLCCFNPDNKKVNNYFRTDGLPSLHFNTGAAFADKDGRLYFGTTRGLVAFNPDNLEEEQYSPKISLTNLELFNRTIAIDSAYMGTKILSKSITTADTIVLSRKHKMVGIEFAAFHYPAPDKIKYFYKLDGFDEQWHEVSAQSRRAVYTNLFPGHYTFKVKTSNANGTESPHHKQIHVHVLTPWFQTAWFRIIAIASFVLLLFGGYRLRIRQLKRQKQKLTDTVEKRTLELKSANQSLSGQKRKITIQKEQIEEQYRNIVALSEIGKQITSSLEIDRVIHNVYKSINELMDAGWLSIGLLDEKSEVINFRFLEPGTETLKEERIALSEVSRISVYAVNNREVLLINDLQREYAHYVNSSSEIYPGKVNSAVYLPLITSKGSVVGIMILKSKNRNAYTKINIEVLKSIAAYSAIAFENAVMYDRLQWQSRQLKEADYIKTRFFINMSHELKTPLTLISSPLGTLKKLNKHPDADKLTDLVIKNTERLKLLINQLLDIRKIENGNKKIELTYGDVSAFLGNIVDLFSEAAKEKKINLKFNASRNTHPLAWFDKDVLEKIVNNLLSNAIKYTPRDESISVEVGRTVKQYIEIHITNTGVVIPRERVTEIFRRFYHYSSSREEMGTGIGLSYVKDLVDLYHGEISVESPDGLSTRFSVIIPAKPEDVPGAVVVVENPVFRENDDLADGENNLNKIPDSGNAVEKGDELPEKNLVLIVEDNADLCEYLASELRCCYEVLTAPDGKKGIDVAKKHSPDLIISDVMMPLINGLELAETLKSDILTSHIPIILLTALSDNTEQVTGLHTGADDYVTKPFSLEVLKARISTLLQNRKILADSILSPGGLKKNSLSKMDQEFIQKCRDLVRNNFLNPEYDYESFFDDLNMSRANCYRKIKALTGKSIGEYTNVEKMNYAAEIITSGSRSITQLAYDMGYNTPSNFTRDFKKVFNKPPSHFI